MAHSLRWKYRVKLLQNAPLVIRLNNDAAATADADDKYEL